jgi:predicted dehydrogenase
MTARRPLGVSVIGLGVGEQHARTYAALPECRLVSVCDLDTDRAGRVARELAARVARADAEVFEDPDIDVVSIASYDDDHPAQLLAALAGGKHVFVEKPLCRSASELAAIKASWAADGGCHVASNLVLRAAPLYQWLRERVQAGVFGEVYAFDGDYLYGRVHKITEEWRSRVPDYSVMLGGGVHLVDLMMWITGQRPRRVSAAGNRIATAGTAFRYHDFVAARYEFESGMVARITANFGCVHRHQHVLRLFGTRGTFIYDDLGPRVHWSRDPESTPEALELSARPASKGALIPQFIDGIVQGREAAPLIQSELDVIAACVAADRSVASTAPTEVVYV